MTAIKDIMTKNVITIDVGKTVFEAAQLMSEKSIGCLVVTDGGVPTGIVTERDFVKRIVAQHASFSVKVAEIMSRSLVTVDPDASVKEAARLMSDNKIRRLPVLKGNKLVGIIVATDLVRNVGKKTTTEEILDAIGRYPSGPIT
jgi:CBS domain-containing protein